AQVRVRGAVDQRQGLLPGRERHVGGPLFRTEVGTRRRTAAVVERDGQVMRRGGRRKYRERRDRRDTVGREDVRHVLLVRVPVERGCAGGVDEEEVAARPGDHLLCGRRGRQDLGATSADGRRGRTLAALAVVPLL